MDRNEKPAATVGEGVGEPRLDSPESVTALDAAEMLADAAARCTGIGATAGSKATRGTCGS